MTTTLPGGAVLTLGGYLPSKHCPLCGRALPAAAFLAKWHIRAGTLLLTFGDACFGCRPPAKTFPAELRAARFTHTFVGDDGQLVGWRERTRAGVFGEPLPLDTLQLRRTADGVYRPQPKQDRRAVSLQTERPRRTAPRRAWRDPRRAFTDDEVRAACLRQGWHCGLCGEMFTAQDGPTGDHIEPWARGGPTTAANCCAVHAHCNSRKGCRTIDEFRRTGRGRLVPGRLDFG